MHEFPKKNPLPSWAWSAYHLETTWSFQNSFGPPWILLHSFGFLKIHLIFLVWSPWYIICSTEKMETSIQYSSANLCIPQMLEGKHYLLILGLISSLLYVLIVLDGKQDKFRIPTSQFWQNYLWLRSQEQLSDQTAAYPYPKTFALMFFFQIWVKLR